VASVTGQGGKLVDSVDTPTRPLLVIIGPSGSGKSTLVRRLAELGVLRVHPTWTTRPARQDEEPTDECLEHRFVDEARFSSLESEGFFLSTTQMFGLPYRYGLPRLELEPDGPLDAVMLRAPLVEQLRAFVPWLLVYQVEADLEAASQRIVARSADDDDARARTAANHGELDHGRRIADRVFTNDGEPDELVDSVTAALSVDYGPSSLSVSAPPGVGVSPPPTPRAQPIPQRSPDATFSPSMRPPSMRPPRRRERSVGEKIAIVVGVIAAVLIAGAVVFGLLFAYALSQWGSNK
jgi:guanylate kinase